MFQTFLIPLCSLYSLNLLSLCIVEHNIPSQSDAIDTKVKPKGRRTKNKMDEISKDEDLVKEQDLESKNFAFYKHTSSL